MNQNNMINMHDVKKFFHNRAIKTSDIGSTMLNSAELISRRDNHEKKIIMPLLNLDVDSTKVLDIGCGVGRWLSALSPKIYGYVGTDFIQDYIEVCQKTFKEEKNIFYNFDVEETIYNCDKFFLCNLIIVNGLCVYLNDKVVDRLFQFIGSYLPSGGQVYLRESVSVTGSRKILKNFFSKELNSEYNAIYRTVNEYNQLIEKYLAPEGIVVMKSDFLLTDELKNRVETNQHWWILKKT